MTTKTQIAFEALLANVESTETHLDDNSTWGTVYTDNARHDVVEHSSISILAFNGCLSILKREGQYRVCEDPEAKRAFGYVRLPAAKAKRKTKANRTSRVASMVA